MKSHTVLVIGAANFDIKGRMFARPMMESSNAASIKTSFGGVARNVAENLARMGVRTHLLTAVGDDIPGRDLLTAADNAGIDVSRALRITGESTGTYLATLGEDGDLFVGLDDIRVLRHLTAGYIQANADLFAVCDLVMFDLNLSDDAIEAMLTLAERHGKPVCADPTAASITGRLRPFLKRLSIVAPNADEAQILLGGFPIRSDALALAAARQLVAEGVEIAVITQDKHGACYAMAGESEQLPAPSAVMVDATGAGDSLTAMVIYGRLRGWPMHLTLRLGQQLAALTLSSAETVARELSPAWLSAAAEQLGLAT
jgi:pseudouridine kinase